MLLLVVFFLYRYIHVLYGAAEPLEGAPLSFHDDDDDDETRDASYREY